MMPSLLTLLLLQDGGLEILEGETIYEHGTLLSVSELYRYYGTTYSGSRRVSDPLDRFREDHRITLAANYGLLPALQLSLLAPYVIRHGDVDVDGIGDLEFFAKYRAWKRDWHLGSFNWSLVAGMQMPTGSTSERDDGVRIASEFQPGSGSVDGVFATAGTLEIDRWKITLLMLYQLNGVGAHHYTFGDVFAAELILRRRLIVEPFPGPLFAAELAIQWRQEEAHEQRSTRVPDTGEERLMLRPTLLLYPRAWWGVEAWGEIPVYRHARGTQLVLDYGLFIAFIYRP